MLKQYWISLRYIWNDVSLLFRNFIHWNLSKIAILGITFVTATLLSIPFFAILWWISKGIVDSLGLAGLEAFFTSGILPDSTLTALLENIWIVGGIIGMILIILTIYTCIMSYGYYLTVRVYQSYLDGAKLPILKNEYLNLKRFWKFIGVLGWSSLYLLAPIGFGLWYILVLFLLVQSGVLDPMGNSVHRPILGGLVVVGTVLFIGYMIYMAIRVLFGYMNMLDADALSVSAHTLIKRSMSLASGNIIRIIALMLPFVFLTWIVGGGMEGVRQYRDIRSLEARIGEAAKADPESFMDDHSYVQREYIRSYALSEDELRDVLAIGESYNPKTDWVDREYLSDVYPYILKSWTMDTGADMAWEVGVAILGFLILEGVMIMVYFSIFQLLRATSWLKTKKTETPEVPAEIIAGTNDFTQETTSTPTKTKKKAPTKEKTAAKEKTPTTKKKTASPKKTSKKAA